MQLSSAVIAEKRRPICLSCRIGCRRHLQLPGRVLRAYVIHFSGRPERRRQLTARAVELGLAFDFVDAVDSRDFAVQRKSVRVTGSPFGRLGDDQLAAMLSHRAVWAQIVARNETHAVVLEDEALLADDAARFIGRDDWLPQDAHLVKLDGHGRAGRKLAVDVAARPAFDRRVLRFHARSAGSAGYVISRVAAMYLLIHTARISLPVEQILFNPAATGLFSELKPYVLEPAICERDIRRGDLASDRRSPTGLRQSLHRAAMDLAMLRYAGPQMSRVLWGRLVGQIELSPLTVSPVHAGAEGALRAVAG